MPALDPRRIAEKTEVALSMTDLNLAGVLNDWQLAALKGIIQAKAKLPGDNEVIIADQKKGKYEYGGFPDRISHFVDENAALAVEKYSKLSLVKVPFDCKEAQAVIPLSDTSVRNNLNKGNLGAFCMEQAAPRIALDIEDYGINCDTDTVDDDYGKFDGLLKQVLEDGAATLDPGSAADYSDTVLGQMRFALPSKYWTDDVENMRFYCSPVQEAVLQSKRISQYGEPGYRYAENDKRNAMTYAGAPIMAIPGMPDAYSILTHKNNILWFLELGVNWELYREALKSRWLYIVRYAFDVAFAVPGAAVVHKNLSVPVTPTS